MAFRNLLINGAMNVDQRHAGKSIAAGKSSYLIDRWFLSSIDDITFSAQRNLALIPPPPSFRNHLGIFVKQPRSLRKGDWFNLVQTIESSRLLATRFGTSDAQPLTLSFWVRSSLPGIHSGGLRNSDSSRTYPFTYPLFKADTWEHKSLTIPGDSNRGWAHEGNGSGMAIMFCLAATPPHVPSADVWYEGNQLSIDGVVSIAGISGATFFITGVQLETGNSASPYETLSSSEELVMCQRYFEVLGGDEQATRIGEGFTAGNEAILARIPFSSLKRAAPTVSITGDEFVFVTESGQQPLIITEIIGAGSASLFLSGQSPGTEAGQDGYIQASGMSKISLSAEM